jgi:molybdopterin-guanine dinucleotide biosynthesis protein A
MNSEEKSKVSGFILAGGKSSRMGTDKSLLSIQNVPLLKRMIDLIDPFCFNVAVSGQNQEYSVFNVDLIPDLFDGCGPIAGLYSSLKYSSTEWNLIVSVDVPFVNEELISLLLAGAVRCDCVIPQHESGIEPLIAVYNKSSIPVIEEMIYSGDFKLMNLLTKLNTKYLDCNSLILKYPRIFLNLNRLEDFQSI